MSAVVHSKAVAVSRETYNVEIKPLLDTCLLMNPKLCGNAICRKNASDGFVRKYFDDLPDLRADNTVPVGVRKRLKYRGFQLLREGSKNQDITVDRLDDPANPVAMDFATLCRDVSNKLCPSFLSERYLAWLEKKADICKAPETNMWTYATSKLCSITGVTCEAKTVGVVEFDTDKWYNNDHTGRNTLLFKLFLVCMMFLFACRMINEFREIFEWSRCMIASPTWSQQNHGIEAFELDPIVRILYGGILLLEAVIAALTLYVGTYFLMGTKQYMELVLNTLALAFIIELDDMIYLSLAFTTFKTFKNGVVVGHSRCAMSCSALIHTVIILTCGAFISYFIWLEFTSRTAEHIKCFCEMEGENCLSARLWQNGPAATPEAYCKAGAD
jgi:hypothetical protein